MKLRKTLALLASAVLLGASPLYPAEAQASTVYGCSQGYLCLFDGTGYGTWHESDFSISYLFGKPCTDLAGADDNTTSSLVVNSSPGQGSHALVFYMNHNCTGTPTPYLVTSGATALPNLTSTQWGNISNAISSIAPVNP
jgi:hypothetical protein